MSTEKVYAGTTTELKDGLTKVEDALSNLKSIYDDPDLTIDTVALQTNGARPEHIIKNVSDLVYFVHGVLGSDLADILSGQVIELKEIEEKFKRFCTDYGMKIEADSLTKAGEFAARVLYNVGPMSRKDKNKDFVAQFNFPFVERKTIEVKTTTDGQETATTKEVQSVVYKTVFVSTFRKSTAPSTIYELKDKKMVLTIKQAGLLATKTICKVIDFAMGLPTPKRILTPLAGAIFSILSITPLSTIFKTSEVDILKTICSSAQSSGHLLEESDIDCAMACVYTATRNMKDGKIRGAIIEKTAKQYLATQRDFSPLRTFVWLYFATGGVPSEMTLEGLTKLHDSVSSARKAAATQFGEDVEDILFEFFKYQVKKGDNDPASHFKGIEFPEKINIDSLAKKAGAGKKSAANVPEDDPGNNESEFSKMTEEERTIASNKFSDRMALEEQYKMMSLEDLEELRAKYVEEYKDETDTINVARIANILEIIDKRKKYINDFLDRTKKTMNDDAGDDPKVTTGQSTSKSNEQVPIFGYTDPKTIGQKAAEAQKAKAAQAQTSTFASTGTGNPKIAANFTKFRKATAGLYPSKTKEELNKLYNQWESKYGSISYYADASYKTDWDDTALAYPANPRFKEMLDAIIQDAWNGANASAKKIIYDWYDMYVGAASDNPAFHK